MDLAKSKEMTMEKETSVVGKNDTPQASRGFALPAAADGGVEKKVDAIQDDFKNLSESVKQLQSILRKQMGDLENATKEQVEILKSQCSSIFPEQIKLQLTVANVPAGGECFESQ